MPRQRQRHHQVGQAGDHAAGNAVGQPAAQGARQRGQQGVVWLSVEVSAAGECAQASVLRSSGVSALDQAALAAVRRWRFVPARQGQTPVESKVEIPIRFKLSDEGAEE